MLHVVRGQSPLLVDEFDGDLTDMCRLLTRNSMGILLDMCDKWINDCCQSYHDHYSIYGNPYYHLLSLSLDLLSRCVAAKPLLLAGFLAI